MAPYNPNQTRPRPPESPQLIRCRYRKPWWQRSHVQGGWICRKTCRLRIGFEPLLWERIWPILPAMEGVAKQRQHMNRPVLFSSVRYLGPLFLGVPYFAFDTTSLFISQRSWEYRKGQDPWRDYETSSNIQKVIISLVYLTPYSEICWFNELQKSYQYFRYNDCKPQQCWNVAVCKLKY